MRRMFRLQLDKRVLKQPTNSILIYSDWAEDGITRIRLIDIKTKLAFDGIFSQATFEEIAKKCHDNSRELRNECKRALSEPSATLDFVYDLNADKKTFTIAYKNERCRCILDVSLGCQKLKELVPQYLVRKGNKKTNREAYLRILTICQKVESLRSLIKRNCSEMQNLVSVMDLNIHKISLTYDQFDSGSLEGSAIQFVATLWRSYNILLRLIQLKKKANDSLTDELKQLMFPVSSLEPKT